MAERDIKLCPVAVLPAPDRTGGPFPYGFPSEGPRAPFQEPDRLKILLFISLNYEYE